MLFKIKEWREKVYRTREVDYRLKTLPRSRVLKRDKYTCQSCRKRRPSGRGLGIHHIIPRTQGGTNQLSNLITLCPSCHDLIELADPPIRTAQEIRYYKKQLDDENKKKTSEDDSEVVIDETDWRTWVYGSGKRPE